VYVAAVETVIDDAVAPVFHCNDPVKPEAVKTELLQLLTTLITGAGTAETSGAAVPLPEALVQPFTVCMTVYVPAAVTVMEEVVAPLLHNNDPVNADAVNTELPQLFTTDTAGAAGIVFGDADVLIVELLHPFTDCETPYVPPVVTVIVGVVAPLLHSKEPVKADAVSNELPQLFTTDNPGTGGIAFGAAVVLVGILEQPLIV
jgi:hypothetical protein